MCFLKFLCMGELLHLPIHTPGWWISDFDEDPYFSKSIFVLSVHSPVNLSSLQSPGEAKKFTEASSNLICLGHHKLSRECWLPPRLLSFKATEMQLQLFYDIPACHKPFQGGWHLKTQWVAYSLWARAHNRMCQDSRGCLDGAVGGESCPGNSQRKSFPEGARATPQPGNLSRNCANEKKLGLSEDYVWYRRTKLFSWNLVFVGWMSQKKRKSECRGEIGLYCFKGQAGQLGRGWATGEGTVGKKKWLNSFGWNTSLQAGKVVYASCIWKDLT